MLPAFQLYYEIIFAVFAFILGSAIGSFLNVCIYRMPLGMSVNQPSRSFCPSCKYQIPWYRNLPLVSWLSLGGKCANCGAKISFRYFGVELLTGLLFLAVWWRVWMHPRAEWHGQGWVLALPYFILAGLLIVATFIDFEHFIIPDQITWGGVIAGAMLSFSIPLLMGVGSELRQMSAALPGLVLWFGCLWLAEHLGGPLRNMRSPSAYGAIFLAGAGLAAIIAGLLGARSTGVALGWSLAGAVLGYLLLWGVVEAGKIAFGKKHFKVAGPTAFTWTLKTVETEHGDEKDADLVVGDIGWKSLPQPSVAARLIDLLRRLVRLLTLSRIKPAPRGESWVWSETFWRESDRLVIIAPQVSVDGEEFSDAKLVFSLEWLEIGDRKWKLENLKVITGMATLVIVPREAMGFGDVKFIAAIGAFLGWQAVLFTVVSASTIGAIVGVTTIILGKREYSAKIPFGPYLALGALLWLFTGPELVRWYLASFAAPPVY